MIIDTHAHLNFNAFQKDAGEVIQRSLESGVWMINVGTGYTTSLRAKDLAQKYAEGVYGAVGLHPINLETGLVKIKTDPAETELETCEEKFDYAKYKDLAGSPKVVAIGEIGLDYFRRPKGAAKSAEFKKRQEEILISQLGLAQDLGLPVIFHCRMAHDDLLRILASRPAVRGVIHCFTGNREQARQYLAMGFYLGLNGIIFKQAPGLPDYGEMIQETALEKILVETDCPYLTPPLSAEVGGQAQGRNEPVYIKYVIQKIAATKKMSVDETAAQTTLNARTVFNIQKKA